HLAQREFGHLSQEAIEYVAGIMDIPPARLYGIVSFYTMLNMKPVGRHHLQVCRTLPCALRGSERVTNYLKKKLGIGPGETTPDRRFTLTEVECLASCGTAPVMQINDDYCENLSEEKIDRILDELK
ncbi:MAG: NADH-quinone oxidoreductase subunit NuoE, partial [Deltaproteobacteria bacterium]|nr:NADH-quinone oxidoreductase subunit NuoE [Deltaproteobacteria bacterium]